MLNLNDKLETLLTTLLVELQSAVDNKNYEAMESLSKVYQRIVANL